MEPFWRIYKQHLDPAVDIQQILAPMRIGTLSAEDFMKETSIQREKKEDDPYKDEPERHPAQGAHGRAVQRREAPVAMLGDPYITPSELWYVRNPPPRAA